MWNTSQSDPNSRDFRTLTNWRNPIQPNRNGRRAAKAHLRVEQLEDRPAPSANPFLVKDIWAGADESFPSEFAVLGSTLYFAASDAANFDELLSPDSFLLGSRVQMRSGRSSPLSPTAGGGGVFRIVSALRVLDSGTGL